MMVFYDIFVILALSIAAALSNSRGAALCALAYTAASIFAWSPAFDYFSPNYSYIHIFYAIIFGYFISHVKREFHPALGLGTCSLFHLFVAADYLFYPNIDTIINVNYLFAHVILVTCLIYLSTKKVDDDGDSDPNVTHIINRVWHMSRIVKRLQRV